jgi:hypothetical protein
MRSVLVLGTLLFAAAAGCQRESAAPATEPASKQVSTATQTAAKADVWEAFYLQGAKIGYGHTTISPLTRNGKDLLEVDSLNHVTITRFGETSEQEIKMRTLETPAGELVEFSTTVNLGPSPTVISGQVAAKEGGGTEMVITTETQGRKATQRIPWNKDVLGFRAVEQSLSTKPMKPGESRTLKMLMPVVNQVAEVELKARELETTLVMGVETRLLPINSVSRLPDNQALETTLWTDADGEVIKSQAALKQESFRTTKQIALAPPGKTTSFDLGLDLFVKVDPPLADPLHASEVVYRVELTDGDPAKVFASGPTQSVKSLGPHVAEITVRSIRPGEANPSPAEDAPRAEYSAPNSVLQTDDTEIRKMAAEAKGAAKTPVELAVALEKYVHGAVNEKNFSHGFATAAEVAQSRAGDCTEHAVLLAALARVVGLPSRVAIGLVYVERAGGFGYHMWTEVFLDGRWLPLDAILGAGGTSAAYLKLNDSSLEGASAYSSFLSVAQVLGQLKISIVSQK